MHSRQHHCDVVLLPSQGPQRPTIIIQATQGRLLPLFPFPGEGVQRLLLLLRQECARELPGSDPGGIRGEDGGLLGQRCRRSRQEEGRKGGRKGGREGGGEGGQDVVLVEVVVEAVRGEEEQVARLGAEGKKLPEFRSIAEGGKEGGREGGKEERVSITVSLVKRMGHGRPAFPPSLPPSLPHLQFVPSW